MNTINSAVHDVKNTAAHAIEGAEGLAGEAKSGFLDTISKITKVVSTLRSLDSDDLLGYAGLQRRSRLSTAATFGAGIALGAGVALLFAPTSGAKMRKQIARSFKALLDSEREDVSAVKTAITEKVNGVFDKVKDVKHVLDNKIDHIKHDVAAR